jgi:hypothetical protein
VLSRYKTYTLLSILILAGVGGCRPDIEELRPSTHPLDDLFALLAQVPEPATKTTFVLPNLQQDTALTTAGGVRITLSDTENLFADPANQPVPSSSCSELTIEVVEVLRKGDILARGLRTTDFDGGGLLESYGQAYLSARCGQTPLHLLQPIKVQLPVPPGQALLTDIEQRYGRLVGGAFAGWQFSGEPAFHASWLLPGNTELTNGYELYTNELGWVGAFRPIVEPTSSFCVTLPAPHSAANSLVMVVLPNSKTTLLLEPDGPESNTFCYSHAPVGFVVEVIVLSKHDGKYWLGRRITEIGSGGTTITIEPEQKTEQTLVNTLKNL